MRCVDVNGQHVLSCDIRGMGGELRDGIYCVRVDVGAWQALRAGFNTEEDARGFMFYVHAQVTKQDNPPKEASNDE